MRVVVLLAICVLPATLLAAPALKLASADEASKRFFSLETEHEKQHGVTIIHESKPLSLRSDRTQIQNGFLRIDRARSTIIPAQRALPPHSPRDSQNTSVSALEEEADLAAKNLPEDTADNTLESEEIIGNREGVDPVLALFDTADATELTSFSDAMRGRSSLASGGHHAFWPIPLAAKQYVSSGFGMRSDPFHGRQTFHGGIDIAADEGTAVLATADATVMKVTSDPRYGKYITLAHADGTLSRYGHLNSQNVREGQRVRGGQVIGSVGSTGRSTGPHLDYRVSRNNTKFDPLSILTLPSQVAFKSDKPRQPVVAVHSGARVASNALPKQPMVIEVR